MQHNGVSRPCSVIIPTAFAADFGLTKAEDYAYLNQSGCFVVEGIDDAEEFKDTVVRHSDAHWLTCTYDTRIRATCDALRELNLPSMSRRARKSCSSSLTRAAQKAMQTMGIDQNLQYEIFRLLAAILWLGNVQFTADAQDHAVINDKRTLEVRTLL